MHRYAHNIYTSKLHICYNYAMHAIQDYSMQIPVNKKLPWVFCTVINKVLLLSHTFQHGEHMCLALKYACVHTYTRENACTYVNCECECVDLLVYDSVCSELLV